MGSFSLKPLLKEILKIIKQPGGAERNLRIKKYISEIKYSPEEIKIEFKTESLFDSSADLSTRTAARRLSQDEFSGLVSLRTGDGRVMAGSRPQALGGVQQVDCFLDCEKVSNLKTGGEGEIRTHAIH